MKKSTMVLIGLAGATVVSMIVRAIKKDRNIEETMSYLDDREALLNTIAEEQEERETKLEEKETELLEKEAELLEKEAELAVKQLELEVELEAK